VSSGSEAFDVIVVGFGYAGAIAAIEAHDAGASVLLLEKQPDPGGISICSAGGLRIAKSAEDAYAYLAATNAGTAPEPVLRRLAEGMTGLPDYVRRLAATVRAVVSVRHVDEPSSQSGPIAPEPQCGGWHKVDEPAPPACPSDSGNSQQPPPK